MYFFLVAFLCIQVTHAQDLFITRHGQVSFFGKTAFENVEAVNNESSSVLNAQTGEIGFAILIKGFHFEKALMEEHFNEDYMESSTIPKASFKGKISNPAAVNFSKDGSYAVSVDGDMTIHGVTKKNNNYRYCHCKSRPATGTGQIQNSPQRLQHQNTFAGSR